MSENPWESMLVLKRHLSDCRTKSSWRNTGPSEVVSALPLWKQSLCFWLKGRGWAGLWLYCWGPLRAWKPGDSLFAVALLPAASQVGQLVTCLLGAPVTADTPRVFAPCWFSLYSPSENFPSNQPGQGFQHFLCFTLHRKLIKSCLIIEKPYGCCSWNFFLNHFYVVSKIRW